MSRDAPAPTPCSDRKSTRLNSSHMSSSYAVFCLKKKNARVPTAALRASSHPSAATRTTRWTSQAPSACSPYSSTTLHDPTERSRCGTGPRPGCQRCGLTQPVGPRHDHLDRDDAAGHRTGRETGTVRRRDLRRDCTPVAAEGDAARCRQCGFFFSDPAPPEIYTLSLHDALPICELAEQIGAVGRVGVRAQLTEIAAVVLDRGLDAGVGRVVEGLVAATTGVVGQADLQVTGPTADRKSTRLNSSHMSISYAVFCLK